MHPRLGFTFRTRVELPSCDVCTSSAPQSSTAEHHDTSALQLLICPPLSRLITLAPPTPTPSLLELTPHRCGQASPGAWEIPLGPSPTRLAHSCTPPMALPPSVTFTALYLLQRLRAYLFIPSPGFSLPISAASPALMDHHPLSPADIFLPCDLQDSSMDCSLHPPGKSGLTF